MASDERMNRNYVRTCTLIVVTLVTLVAFLMAMTTLPRSGPSCAYDECVTYPYTDITDYFPRDYLWMFPAALLLPPFVLLMAFVHEYAAPKRKAFSLAGVCFASIATAVLGATYFVQLTVVQPSVIRGETDGLSLFSQYNPHGLFIALESVGYMSMSIALGCIAAVFTGATLVERLLRWALAAAFVLMVVALVGFVAAYGNDLEYRFEIAVISIDWIALMTTAPLISIVFRREVQGRSA